jgi:hypothetical protein
MENNNRLEVLYGIHNGRYFVGVYLSKKSLVNPLHHAEGKLSEGIRVGIAKVPPVAAVRVFNN